MTAHTASKHRVVISPDSLGNFSGTKFTNVGTFLRDVDDDGRRRLTRRANESPIHPLSSSSSSSSSWSAVFRLRKHQKPNTIIMVDMDDAALAVVRKNHHPSCRPIS